MVGEVAVKVGFQRDVDEVVRAARLESLRVTLDRRCLGVAALNAASQDPALAGRIPRMLDLRYEIAPYLLRPSARSTRSVDTSLTPAAATACAPD